MKTRNLVQETPVQRDQLSIFDIKFDKVAKNDMAPPIQRTTMTAKQAAEYLGISYWFITILVKRKQLPCIRLGNRLLFREETLRQYLEDLERDSVQVIEDVENEYGKVRRLKV